jgi:hypothetical protein
MPVILATWEAEIRRTAVQGQPEQIVHKTPISFFCQVARGKAGRNDPNIVCTYE